MFSKFKEYLKQREADLYEFHPQFFCTNEEIVQCNDVLKRDLTPICIPPSWDLVQKYAGALDENADGFNKVLYEKGKRLYVGDQGEAEFSDLMRKLPIGGILIGDVNSQHLLYGHQLNNKQKEYFMLPSQITKPLKKAKDFQFDFVYFDSKIGLIHIEIKRVLIGKQTNRLAHYEQIKRQREKLEELFEMFCKSIGEENVAQTWQSFFIAPSILLYFNASDVTFIKKIDDKCIIFAGIRKLEQFFTIQKKLKKTNQNLFKNEIFKQFIIFLSGYRPNFFISPVQCALHVYKNIFTHYINTANYYAKNKDEPNLQNEALTTKDFLKSLKFVENTDINFWEYENIYLTKEQMEAIGKFDGNGNFSPKKQLIFGPPGSGKSLILMIKIFICGQMEDRKDRPMLYCSESGYQGPSYGACGHVEKLIIFIANNRQAIRRKTCGREKSEIDLTQTLQEADVFVDEDYGWDLLIPKSAERAMFVSIHTGNYGEYTGSANESFPRFQESSNFETVTRLCTIFRSSRQIQNYFMNYAATNEERSTKFLNGHNFDGVKVEIHEFSNGMAIIFVEKLLAKLRKIESCSRYDIGVFFRSFRGRSGEWEKVRRKFKSINFYKEAEFTRSLEYPVWLAIVDMEDREIRDNLFLLASRAICHLIICNIVSD